MFLQRGELSYGDIDLDRMSADDLKSDLLRRATAFYEQTELTSPVMRESSGMCF